MKKLQKKLPYSYFLRVIQKKPANEVSNTINSPPGVIYKWTHLYNKFGINGLLSNKKGGRKREIISKENEKKVLEEIKNDASVGLVVTAKCILQKIINDLKKAISRSYIYDFLKNDLWII